MNTRTPYRKSNVFPWNGLNELERIFDSFVTPAGADGGNWAPAVDVRKTEEGYIIDADLPGMEKNNITIKVEGDVVSIGGERKTESKEQDKDFHRIERSYGTFHRSFRIPGGIEADKVVAEYKNGVLQIRLPRPESAKPRQIDVQVE